MGSISKKDKTLTAIGRNYNVSCSAVRKWAKKIRINLNIGI